VERREEHGGLGAAAVLISPYMTTSFQGGKKITDGRVVQASGYVKWRSRSNPLAVHTTVHWADGDVSCNCKGWGTRGTCEHTRRVREGLVSLHLTDAAARAAVLPPPEQAPTWRRASGRSATLYVCPHCNLGFDLQSRLDAHLRAVAQVEADERARRENTQALREAVETMRLTPDTGDIDGWRRLKVCPYCLMTLNRMDWRAKRVHVQGCRDDDDPEVSVTQRPTPEPPVLFGTSRRKIIL